MGNISPGVYTKIIDLSAYVASVPGTISFIAGLTKEGEDNVMKFVGSRGEFIGEYGEPNISDYGKNYGQGPYLAYNYLGESGALYWMRALPDDATYANFRIDGVLADGEPARNGLDGEGAGSSVSEDREQSCQVVASLYLAELCHVAIDEVACV